MSAQAAYQSGSHNIIVQASGNNIDVQIGKPHLKLIPVQARTGKEIRREIDILNPASQAVPLVGRDDDMRFLHNWLTSAPPIATLPCSNSLSGAISATIAIQRTIDGCN